MSKKEPQLRRVLTGGATPPPKSMMLGKKGGPIDRGKTPPPKASPRPKK